MVPLYLSFYKIDVLVQPCSVFLLVALKNTLVSLDIASNPCINDSSVCALLLLSNLKFLSICDTGIGMVGLRELAKTIVLEDRIIDIEIPTVCEFYIDSKWFLLIDVG